MAKLPVLTEKQRLILSIAVISVGTLGLGTVWGFGFKEGRLLDKDIRATRVSLAGALHSLDGLEDLRRQHASAAERTRRLGQLLPDRPDLERVYEILQEAERLAGKSGASAEFTLLAGKPFEDKSRAKKAGAQALAYEEISLELTASGTWAGFVSFLDSLEHSDRLIAVKSFKTSGADNNNPLLYTYKIVVSDSTLKPPPGAPK